MRHDPVMREVDQLLSHLWLNTIWQNISEICHSEDFLCGHCGQWIEAFLGDRSQSVLVDGVRSKEEAVVSGVPQGTVIGPLLFLLYINDMPEHVHTGTRCRLFADDTLLYRVIDTTADHGFSSSKTLKT